MFDRFTESARRMLFFARYEAGRAGAASIEPEHLLFGLLRDIDTVARRVLERHRLDIQRLHHQLEARGGDPIVERLLHQGRRDTRERAGSKTVPMI